MRNEKLEDQILEVRLLETLLKDRTTKKNIIWATSDYEDQFGVSQRDEMSPNAIYGMGTAICPSAFKGRKVKDLRRESLAEVCTPAWLCNKQNNSIDDAWFGKKSVFNTPFGHSWRVSHKKISFPPGKDWREYVKAARLEVTCGEAPYLTSRYDALSGTLIPLERRIGFLDRKFRIVEENTSPGEEWVYWAIEALKSTYGYEFQGDSLFLARKNLLLTFSDYFVRTFCTLPPLDLLQTAGEVISWNLWQMDGSTFAPPFVSPIRQSLFSRESTFCIIRDWSGDNAKELTYKSLLGEENEK